MAAVALAAPQRAQKLRVGVFADARLQPAWVVEALEKVAASEFAELVLVQAGDTQPESLPLLWRLYQRADRWAFGAADCAALRALPEIGTAADPASLGLDVAFLLGGVEDERFDGLARYGVWRFCFGDEHLHAEALAGLPEVARGAELTGSGIKVRLGPGEPVRLAYQSWSRTYALSVARNRAQLLRKTAEFAWRALRELHAGGPEWLRRCAVVRGDAPAYPDALAGLSSIGRRILRRGVEKALYVEQWFLAWRFSEGRLDSIERLDAIEPGLAGFVRAVPPPDRIWADPFALEKNGRYFVFFEELPFQAGKAHISMVEVKRDGSFSAPVRVLERDYHLSYPFLLEQDGELFMIPESAQNGSVEVYRCIDFPRRWKLEKTLLDGVRLVDATFHRDGGAWWMFANAAAPGSRVFDDELHLFHADALLGRWRPHPKNPVKSDARSARPAGQLFRRRGALFRPAQICAPRYGAGLTLHRVERLTPHDYEEREVQRILPGAGLLGLHTVNRAGGLTVVDAFARRRRFSSAGGSAS